MTSAPLSSLDLDDPRTDPAEVARAAAEMIRIETGVERHDVALTLGSGWSKAADALGETVAEIPAERIPGFSRPAVAGHTGTIRSVRLAAGGHALIMGARTHFYEGRGVRRVVHSVRAAAATGARILVLTNGAGGLRPEWTPGTPVLIADHINLTAASPLEGATFIDCTDLYSARLRAVARAVEPLDEGVYVQFRGPQYETPAEVRMAGRIGGDIVGMSTALEAVAAREAGLEVLGLSLITNAAAGIADRPLDHAEVLQAGKDAEPRLAALLARIVARIVAHIVVADRGASTGDESTAAAGANAPSAGKDRA